MDAGHAQAFILAWGAVVTTLIGVLVTVIMAIRGAIAQMNMAVQQNSIAVVAVAKHAESLDHQINGAMTARINAGAVQAIQDDKQHPSI